MREIAFSESDLGENDALAGEVIAPLDSRRMSCDGMLWPIPALPVSYWGILRGPVMSLTFTARRLSQARSHGDGAVICVGDSLTMHSFTGTRVMAAAARPCIGRRNGS